ncbi:hypothetical protein F383_36558 [Gossypium arboreum]|uniref:Uncharacterized protein n=1 Tax=Gossypium arboreum TaxID=29729 RepID=A0A0B0M9A8_GOSAR|nr:hypothetical protein F383_36558 [Gossypium arboreum]
MPTSQAWSYMQSHIDATVPNRVLHESNVITYRCQRPRRGLTRERISKILCHDICILLFLRFVWGFQMS